MKHENSTIEIVTTAPNHLIDIAEVSQQLGVRAKTVYSWVHTRQIPFIKVGRLVKFQQKDIEAWIEKRKVKEMVE